MKTPVVDMGCCILCEICTEIAPHAFHINDTGVVETLYLENYSDRDTLEAINNCPRGCITWD